MGYRRSPPLLLAAGLLTAAPSLHAAGDADLFELPLEQLEQLVVTAQKRVENPQEIPVTMAVFSGEDVLSYGIQDTQALQLAVPGLVFSNTGSSAQPYLRGVGTRFAFAGLEPSVATYVDDRYVARAQATLFELADVERIEVLKGPQGTLYGRNAVGGAIRVVTRDVGESLSGSVVGTLGDYDLRSLSATLNVPLSTTLGARFTALVKERDGYAENLDPRGSRELDDRDVRVLRGKFRWDVSDIVTTRLTLQHSKQEDNFRNDTVDLSPPGLNTGIAAGGISGRDVDEVATALRGVIDDESTSADLRVDVALDGFDLISITSLQDFEQNSITDADGTSAAALDVPTVPQEARAVSQEFQLVSSREGDWRWIAGAYLFDETADFEILLDRGTLDSQGDQRADTRAFALFGQASYAFAPAWTVTVGGRWSFEKKKARVRASTLTDITLPPVPFADKASWKEFTPKIALERRFTSGMAYLSYARGFKSGGYNYAASLSGGRVLDPELLDMFEVGWKTSLLGGRLMFNGAAYYYDYRDLQVTRAAAGSGVNITENAADAEVYGVDLDVTWSMTDRLSFTAGANLLDSEYGEYSATATVFNAALFGDPDMPGMSTVAFDAQGESLLRAPDRSLFAAARMRVPLGAATLPIVLSYSYKGDYLFDFIADPSSQRLRQKSHGLLSARATLISPDQSWSLALWGNNLTDEDDYFTDIVANSTGIRGSYGEPRTWGVDLSYRF
ncbi:MAG: TonB-dependent receptor [Pseudomonadales bacterium]